MIELEYTTQDLKRRSFVAFFRKSPIRNSQPVSHTSVVVAPGRVCEIEDRDIIASWNERSLKILLEFWSVWIVQDGFLLNQRILFFINPYWPAPSTTR